MGYWDIPDGTDCVQKTWLTTKLSVALGLAGCAYHVVAFQPKTVLEGVQRVGGATLTMASLGAIFGITTCVTAQIREKPDDLINYFVGGCVSGAFLGVRAHSYATGTSACVAFGVLAALAKSSKRDGWEFLTSEPKL
ncbi:NADH dehydrogenase [ubiquinone] 1 alpha subcomplex subunit 11 [Anomaloglossus baeobatrachus]|uniref:NADH dehydrogenase [ubiquinone] 1 alpha subcomplex subunit 11 n=1 Tax=Anomaloglossus baeobatrachus TaxID=238106 RepID=UPI003F4F61B9